MQHEKSLTDTFIAMAVADRPASLQALWRFIAMVKDRNWRNQSYRGLFGTFTIVKGHHPVALCGEGLVVALHCVRGPNAAYHRLAQRTRSLALVTSGSLLSCMVYEANCPCGKGLIVAPSSIAILGKGFVVAFGPPRRMRRRLRHTQCTCLRQRTRLVFILCGTEC
jgi:hypothetical protein